MDNENKWEYDYSSQDKNESGDTGYPNVGSSGMNTANQYNDPQPEPETAYTAPQTDNGAGGATPPVHPVQPQDAQPPKKKKKFNGKRVARSAVALVLAAAMGFAGGFVGAKFGGSGKVVIQQVAPSSTADSAPGSDSSITAASSSGSSLTTEQVADLVSPSVVVITTEQVVYSQWSWYGQNQVESGAGSGVIISSDGYILTCAHVVDGASTITVTIGDKDYTATLVGEDTTSDIAVIKIDADGLTPATVGNSDSLKVGQSVMAVGNPLGELGGTVTGGMISAALTSIPGASEWFERGFVTYTNQAKHEMLDVPQSILDRFSAVSTQTVSQMLEGAIRHSNATMAVAVSGIAGPDGAMPGRPVGTVFIGWKRKDEMAEVGRYEFKGDRQSVREQTVAVAIQGLVEMLDERQPS